MLQLCSGRYEREGADRRWVAAGTDLEVHALYDGDELVAWETVLTIEGDYGLLRPPRDRLPRRAHAAHARRTNVRGGRARRPAASRSSSSRPASTTTGCRPATATRPTSPAPSACRTDAQASWWGGRGIGTVPHGLIAACGGDTVEAARRFADRYYPDVNVVAAGRLGQRLRRHLAGLRPRPGRAAVGRAARHGRDDGRPLALGRRWDASGPTASRRELVRAVRARARRRGLHARADRRQRRLRRRAHPRASRRPACPADAYGVGSSLLRGNTDFTADVVMRRRPAVRQGRPGAIAQPAPRARRREARPRAGPRPVMERARPRRAIIVVDMLNGFCRRGKLRSPRSSSVVAGACATTSRARRDRRAAHLPRRHPSPRRSRVRRCSRRTAWRARARTRSSPSCGSSPERGTGAAQAHASRASTAPSWRAILARLRPDVVEVVGVCTDICVLHTVADLRDRGLRGASCTRTSWRPTTRRATTASESTASRSPTSGTCWAPAWSPRASRAPPRQGARLVWPLDEVDEVLRRLAHRRRGVDARGVLAHWALAWSPFCSAK